MEDGVEVIYEERAAGAEIGEASLFGYSTVCSCIFTG